MNPTLLGWLQHSPTTDAVDRRKIKLILSLLLLLAVSISCKWTFALATPATPWPAARQQWPLLLSLGSSLSIVVMAAIAGLMLRRSLLQPAAHLLLAILLTMLLTSAAINGLQQQLHDQLAPMLLLILSGLVLHRRALWSVFATLLLCTVIGGMHDAPSPFPHMPAHVFYILSSTIFGYFIIAMLVDRSSQALRESLRESHLREQRLRREMLAHQQAQLQLVHAQKQQISEHMASGLAHDLNHIFAVVIGLAAVGREQDEDNDKVRLNRLDALLDAINESALRGMAASRRLLHFSRPGQTVIELFDVGQAITQARQMLRQLLDARIVLELELAAHALPIRFDRSQFELLLLNLAANSNDAISGSGHFRIHTRQHGDWVEIAVIDDGCGMPAEVAARMFEAFFSTKSADCGTGLGLTMVQQLVHKAAGEILVDSAPGRGTRLQIRLPLAIELSPSA